jgi:hypothetical protein
MRIGCMTTRTLTEMPGRGSFGARDSATSEPEALARPSLACRAQGQRNRAAIYYR